MPKNYGYKELAKHFGVTPRAVGLAVQQGRLNLQTKEWPGLRKKACSKCRNVGHYARTCLVVDPKTEVVIQ